MASGDVTGGLAETWSGVPSSWAGCGVMPSQIWPWITPFWEVGGGGGGGGEFF